MVRRAIRGVGRTMIAAGVLILLFVAYELWGTGIAEARSQRNLKSEFAKTLRADATTTTTAAPKTPGATGAPTVPTTAVDNAPPPAPDGTAVALITIPRIGLSKKAVVQGVGVPDLKRGPGHYPQSPMPGQPGNAAIAGHRTTYGAPFNRIDELQPGDKILVTTRQGPFEYQVTEKKVVSPSALEVLAPTKDNRLTLTTCHPKLSARQRLIVIARLVGIAAPAPPPAPAAVVKPGQPPASIPGDAPNAAPVSFEDGGNLSGVRSAARPAFVWGALAALVALATYVASRKWRKWPAYLLGTPLFLLVLFVFFENFSRLLPANI